MKKIAISIGIVAIAAATACSKETPVANSPTVPERIHKAIDPVKIKALDDDIGEVERQLSDARADDARYTGGLIKSLIQLRVQTLLQTRAMLDQRRKSWLHSIEIRYTVDGKMLGPPNEADLAALATEIETTRASVLRSQTDADQYSGGLIRALALSTNATERNTLAMLEQKRVSLKYGLPQFIGFAADLRSGTATEAPPAVAPAAVIQSTPPNTPAPAPLANAPNKQVEIVDVSYRTGEANQSWTRFAWRLTLRNNTPVEKSVGGYIFWLDPDGFSVKSTPFRDLIVPPNSSQTFSDDTLIDASQVRRVSNARAKIEWR